MRFNLTHQYILASSSPMRQRILKQLDIPFSIIPSHIDESILENEKPDALVSRLGRQKCEALASQYPDAVLISGDQVMTLENEILGKPSDIDDAFQQLSRCSGHWVTSLSNVSVLFKDTVLQKTATCRVKFRTLSEVSIRSYLKDDIVLNCAGSLCVEGLGVLLLEGIESTDPFSIYGMPLIALSELFQHPDLVDL